MSNCVVLYDIVCYPMVLGQDMHSIRPPVAPIADSPPITLSVGPPPSNTGLTAAMGI